MGLYEELCIKLGPHLREEQGGGNARPGGRAQSGGPRRQAVAGTGCGEGSGCALGRTLRAGEERAPEVNAVPNVVHSGLARAAFGYVEQVYTCRPLVPTSELGIGKRAVPHARATEPTPACHVPDSSGPA